MEHIKPSAPKLISGLFTCAVAWLSIIVQFYLTTGSAANFFSYFTILSNLLVAISLTFMLLLPNTKPATYFNSLSVQTAIALYIFIVGLVYNTVLRGILKLSGWSFLVDNLLHVVVPVLYLLYWFIFIPKGRLLVKDSLYWLLFPAVYLCYSLVRGAMVHWYPYPFLDADKLGYAKVGINSAAMLAVFLVAGILFMALKDQKAKAPQL